MLYWDAGKSELKTFDGRETAPASATPDRFLIDGKPMPFETAVRSGLSIGVPGIVRLMETVHAQLRAPAVGAPVRAGDPPRRDRL